MEGSAPSPFSFRSGRNKVRKLREVRKNPWLLLLMKEFRCFCFLFLFLMQTKRVFSVLRFVWNRFRINHAL